MPELLDRLKNALADRYAIQEELGAGGMATVYLAEDLKHHRKVAVKVLHPELAAILGGERFLKEIEVTANLQHPNILALYDSGVADGFLYYVMPHIEGETLREKLNRERQLSIDETLKIAEGVAAALDYAHQRDVIHRDIKPENILFQSGQALVADFGIALAVSEAGGERLTETGLSLGTPHYMSPEQAMADRELTARTDVYSLGCVVYEMLAGEPPHIGGSAQAVVAKILSDDVAPMTKLRRSVPRHVDMATRKALERTPADRFATGAEFVSALTNAAFTVATISGETTRPAPRREPWKAIAAVLGVLVVVLAITTVMGSLGESTASQVARFGITLPEDAALTAAIPGWTVALSPDGRHLIYVGPGRMLYVRPIDRLEARVLPGTEASDSPVFSPDGAWVLFNGGADLKRVALSGGPAVTIAQAPQMRGATWESNEAIIYAPVSAGGLHRANIVQGTSEPLTTPDGASGEIAHRWPAMLPGDEAFVFTVYTGAQESHLATYTFATGEIKQLAVNGMSSHFIETGHLVYLTNDGALLAVPFDPHALEVRGAPLSLADGVMAKTTGAPEFSFSRNGTLAYLSGRPPRGALVLVDGRGRDRVLVADLEEPAAPRFSPDGTRIALELVDEAGNEEIWVHDVQQKTTTRLTFDGANRYPSWTPDGTRIAFASLRGDMGTRQLFWKAADQSGVAELLRESPDEQWESAWLPDGNALIVSQVATTGATGLDVWVAPLETPDSAYPFLATEFQESSVSVSPDGRWLAYMSNESGRSEVYVQPLGRAGGKRLVSTGGGIEPRWAQDGRELYYRSGTLRTGGQMMAVAIQLDPAFAQGTRRTVFEDRFLRGITHVNYDLHPTTGEFVMIRSESNVSFQLTVVLNFFDELRAKVGN
ncbi:MAG: protein kinase [Gemmatimonadetes bacterium]|nr:protein kinase [Gemmatimonadota bacterium]